MSDAPKATITGLYRYPVKGMSPESLDRVEITEERCFPHDRIFAVENGSRDFDPVQPRHFPKIKFLQLMRNERLATLETRFDGAAGTLTILREGRQVAAGNLDQKAGRQIIEQFLAAYLPDDIRGAPRIVRADGHNFTDVEPKWLSIINLASVRDLERVLRKPVDPLRFRANIYIDNGEPWSEFGWIDAMLNVAGQAALKVMSRIKRCAATNVDPQTGSRDMAIPRTLMEAFGHPDIGIYVSARTNMVISRDDEIMPGG